MAGEAYIATVDGLTLYARLRRQSDRYVWNTFAAAFEPEDVAHWYNLASHTYAIPMAKTVLSAGVYAEYAAALPAGVPDAATQNYYFEYYVQGGAAPAAADGPPAWEGDTFATAAGVVVVTDPPPAAESSGHTIIPFTWIVNGVAADVTSAVLSDPTGTYGLKRTDTGEILVPDGTPMAHDGTGQYSYTLTDPAPALPYEYYIEVVYAGHTYRFDRATTGSVIGTPAGGRYCNFDDLVAEMGFDNAMAAADPDSRGDAASIDNSFNKAFSAADTRIDATATTYGIATPLTRQLGMVRDAAAALTAYYLWRIRGARQGGGDNNERGDFEIKYANAIGDLKELFFLNRGGFQRSSSDRVVTVAAAVDGDGRAISASRRGLYWTGTRWQWAGYW